MELERSDAWRVREAAFVEVAAKLRERFGFAERGAGRLQRVIIRRGVFEFRVLAVDRVAFFSWQLRSRA